MDSPLEQFLHWEKATPHNIFLKQPVKGEWREISFLEAGRQARILAQALLNQGLKPGSKVAILSKNCAHWFIADLAIMMVRMISVPIYPTLSANGIEPLLIHSESELIFVGKLDQFQTQKPGIPANIKRISFPWYGVEEGLLWDDLLASVTPLDQVEIPDQQSLMTIMYSSGTTGTAKGVMLSHAGFAWVGKQICSVFGIKERQTLFSYLPLSHIAERGLLQMIAYSSGSLVAFAESLDSFAANLATIQPTIFGGVPRIYSKFQEGVLKKFAPKRLSLLLRIPGLGGVLKKVISKKLGLSKAGLIVTGASPIPIELLNWFQTLGISIHEVYGMTENIAYSHANYKTPRFGSVGHALPGVECRITSAGEIEMKHPYIMSGYYKDEETSKECIDSEGFFKTGDKGWIDEDGYLFITGRIKDQFKTEKGKFISPAPIELELMSNPAIEQACVVGLGLPQPIALIVLSEIGKSKSREDLESTLRTDLETLNKALERYEHVAKLVILREAWTIENNLMTPSLKIKRNEVEKIYKDRYNKWFAQEGLIQYE